MGLVLSDLLQIISSGLPDRAARKMAWRNSANFRETSTFLRTVKDESSNTYHSCQSLQTRMTVEE